MSKQNMSTLTGAKSADKSDFSLIDESFLKSRIYTIRGIKVMVDSDLAEIYGYTTKAFNRQVKNNIEKFEDDFRFQLTKEEYYEALRSKMYLRISRCNESTKYAKVKIFDFKNAIS